MKQRQKLYLDDNVNVRINLPRINYFYYMIISRMFVSLDDCYHGTAASRDHCEINTSFSK